MTLKSLRNELEALKTIKAENDTLKSEKSVSRRDIDDLKANLEAEKREIKEISEKELDGKMPRNFKIVDFVKHLINNIKQWKEAYNTLKAENETLKAEADKHLQEDFAKEFFQKNSSNTQNEDLK